MKRIFVITGLFILVTQGLFAQNNLPAAGLTLPQGFTGNLVATGIKSARHIAVTPQGGIYVKLNGLMNGKGIVYLKDANGDGIIDEQNDFGDYGGTGIVVKNGWLYASSNSEVFRYKLNDKGEVVDGAKPEKIITGLVDRNRDNAKAFALDGKGNIYVNVGSYVNACLVTEGSLTAPSPCPLLDSVGGIWKFKAGKLNQAYKDGEHYATGFKNAVGLDWNTQTSSLFIMQHGRDQLHDVYPQYYTAEQATLLPAETMYNLHKGSNGGWPYIYYDPQQHKKILAPEYGGDGKKTGGDDAQDPLVAFPAHLAPNDILFYTGNSFPEKYKHGAFIAFHGNSPELHKGYFVAFVPFKDGKPAGDWEIFADGFGGPDYNTPGKGPQHKPCGLAQGPDGALYVADDAGGTIYKIQYNK